MIAAIIHFHMTEKENQDIVVQDKDVIAAGSVVTRDCEENCLYAGNQVRKIKEL